MKMQKGLLCGLVAVLLTLLIPACRGQDNPEVSRLFSDHMVLQRDMPVPVWGTARPAAKVTVKFGQQEKTVVADKDGKWLVRLDAMKASLSPAELTIMSATGNKPVKIADVLVGDVYLCGGQSNMAFTMNEIRAADDMAKADFPLMRHSRCGDGWAVCSPSTIGNFSAVGFYFARRVLQETRVPIGLLNNAMSGSPIEQWIEPSCSTPPKTPDNSNPGYGSLYGYTQRLIPFAFRSLLWYQGESNGDDEAELYLHKLKALIDGWRKAWNQGDFPVYIVQLASYMWPNPKPEGGDGWAGVRMAQLMSLGRIRNTGLVVIIDIGEPGNIHPGNKFDTGNRLALWALAKDHGRKDLVCSGPLYRGMRVEDGKIRLTFDSVGKGLMVGSKKDKDPVQEVPGGKLKQFAIATATPTNAAGAVPAGLAWFWADAVIDGDTVVVSSPEVSRPVAVHYAYSRNPEGCNLYNKDGLPASPFRTEK